MIILLMIGPNKTQKTKYREEPSNNFKKIMKEMKHLFATDHSIGLSLNNHVLYSCKV